MSFATPLYPRQFTDTAMASLQTAPHLTSLRMNGIHSATSSSMVSLVSALPHLAVLDLGQNRKMDGMIHEIALKSIIINFGSLKTSDPSISPCSPPPPL